MTKNLYLILDGERIEIHAVSSDHHISHRNIAKYVPRPFNNTESTAGMDDALVRNHNSIVGPDQNTLVCGDVALGTIADSLAVWERFNGKIFLIPGNHDQIAEASRNKPARRERMRPLYEQTFERILPESGVRLIAVKDGEERALQASHYPSAGDSHSRFDEDRYAQWRPNPENGPIIHGHTHSPEAFSPSRPREFHVGVDAHNLFPITADVIVDWVFSL